MKNCKTRNSYGEIIPQGANYTETVDYLYSLQRHGIKLGLENPGKLMDILGRPEMSFRSIHIAGTNGKGSTSAIIASILREHGFRTGLFTSPHLVSFTERIRINNVPISESDVIRLASYVRNVIAGTDLKPTFFEVVTAMAFYYFAHEKVDWAVVEVGMGGRLDATNVLFPQASIITNISLEHTEFLGKNIPEIAFEKAGIIKPSVPLVTAVGQPDALKVIEDTVKKLDAEMHLYGKDFKGEITSMDKAMLSFNYSGYKDYNNLSLPLAGRHQLYNASLAIRTCEILMQKGLSINEDTIYNGITNLNFEGRLEQVSEMPPIILDGAHNPHAAETLAAAIKELFPDKKIILIAGVMKDKDTKGILKPLTDISETIILTMPKGERAAHPQRLKEAIVAPQSYRPRPESIKITNTVEEAIGLARILWKQGDIILITGSFYTTGEAKEVLGQHGVLSQLRE